MTVQRRPGRERGAGIKSEGRGEKKRAGRERGDRKRAGREGGGDLPGYN